MAIPSVIKTHEAHYGGKSRVTSELISEPIVVNSRHGLGEYALFHLVWNPSGNREVVATLVGEGFETSHFMSDDRVIELGDGDFNRGVMEFAKSNIPNPDRILTIIDLDTGISYTHGPSEPIQ